MPSLRCKIKHLCHNGTITESERDKILKALEREPKILEILDFAIDASSGDTNYFVGFRNGLRYAKTLVDGEEEPQYESCTEQRSKWIPISERLPEKNMYCLVSVGQLYLTQIAMYSDLMGIIDHKIFHQGNCGYNDFKDITEFVKAWMPLPEEYKPESEVTE